MEYPEHRVLSVEDLADLIKESNENGARFCFILGSGASVESEIPSGGSLEMRWMDYLMGEVGKPDPGRAKRTRRKADSMKDKKLLEHEFSEIEHIWLKAKAEKKRTLPSKYYFDIYRLRFYPDKTNGYRSMEQIMEQAKPSIGYHTLSLLLTETNLNNLLITTNFDSLVEDALSIYSDKKPLVIAHESLAGYIELDTKRPIIAKIHRGLFFEPFNSPDETNSLRKEWREALSNVFQRYAPIVIGYGGGDGSLMPFLEEESTRMKHGLYWCIREGKEPEQRIKDLVEKKEGCFVEIKGFDGLMLSLGQTLYGDAVIPTGTDRLLKAQYEKRMERYNEQFQKLNEKPELNAVVEPLKEEEKKEAAKREETNTMTATDYFNRAHDAKEAGRHEDAIADYSKAIELKPDYASAYNGRGNVFNRVERYYNALADLYRAIELQPDDAIAFINRGNAYYGLNLNDEALADYSKAIELKPDYSVAYRNRSITYRRLKRYENALADVYRAIELKPDYAEAYNNRGNVYDDTGRYQEALADFSKAIELQPDDPLYYRNRGSIYHDMKRYKEALADENKAIELKPDYANAYNVRGVVYKDTGRSQEALADYSKAIELQPSDPLYYRNRGSTYRKLERYKEALADENKAIELKPDYADAYNDRGNVYDDTGRYQEALADYSKAIELQPDKPLYYRNRAITYRKLGKTDLAEADEAKAEELEKKNK